MKTTENQSQFIGPVLALDLGEKLVGAAVSDERLVTTKRLQPLKRSNWKKLLQDVRHLLETFDAKTVVVGLPLRMDGSEGEAAEMFAGSPLIWPSQSSNRYIYRMSA